MILDAILSPILGIVNKFIPDTAARDAAKAQISEALIGILAQEEKDQAAINQAEAGSANLFVSGWRPAIGWCCALALIYQFLFIPFVTWWSAIFHLIIPVLPTLSNDLWQLMTGMLGLGGLRSIEKIQGVAK